MARGIYVVTNGRYRPMRRPSIMVAGVDTKILAGWTKVAGVWRQFWPPQLPAAVVAIGAGGGKGGDDRIGGYLGRPGHQITTYIPIGTDQEIEVGIGGRGGDGYSGAGTGAGEPGIGGPIFGGGPGGNSGPSGWSGGGGAGGGATYIKVDGINIVVAAGGAGGGGGGQGYVPPPDPPPSASIPDPYTGDGGYSYPSSEGPPPPDAPPPSPPAQNDPPAVAQPAPEPPLSYGGEGTGEYAGGPGNMAGGGD